MVMWGDDGVGKTALVMSMIMRYHYIDFVFLSDCYKKTIHVKSKPITIDIFDTAGCYGTDYDYGFSISGCTFISTAKIIFICFDITNRDTWNHVDWYRNKLLNIKGACGDKDYVVILVATKCDMKKRQVLEEEILNKMHEWKVVMVETSYKEKTTVKWLIRHAIFAYWINCATQCMKRDA